MWATFHSNLNRKRCDNAPVFPPGVPRNLRNDLLVAADSITNTMSSLVKELHSGLSVPHTSSVAVPIIDLKPIYYY